MRCLFLDTSTASLTIGLVNDDKLIYQLRMDLVNEHSKKTIAELNKAFLQVGLEPKDIDKLVVLNGPGSFTGIRIGLTIAKVYSWALSKPIVPISSLRAMAYSTEDADYIVPVIDARRGNVYGAIYDSQYQVVLDEQFLELETLLERVNELSGKIVFMTSMQFTSGYDVVEPDFDILKIIRYVDNDKGVDPHLLCPNYLKNTEAEDKIRGGV